MSRFQPTQGPGLGFTTIDVSGRALNDGDAGARGQAKGLLTSAAGPYAQMTGTPVAQVAVGLTGVLLDDVEADHEENICVVGACRALLGGTVLTNDPMTIFTDGTFIAATIGTPVVARALQGGVAGDLIRIDFDGDQGFGPQPS